MPSISVPDEELPKLKEIAELPQDRFDSFVGALRQTGPSLTGGQFESEVAKHIPNFSDEVSRLLPTIFALYWLKDRFELSPDDLATAVTESICKQSPKDFPKDKAEALRNRLVPLMGFDRSIGVTTKANDVMTEHPHVFGMSRILSDIRPVFSESSQSPAAAVIIHNLQIGFHDSGGGEHKEFYVALDSDDLEQLKSVIVRAENKDKAMRAMIETLKIPHLEP